MLIAKVETKIVRTPFKGNFKTTYGEMAPYQSHLIVRITTKSGLSGIGEASQLPFFTGETADTMKIAVEKELGPAIIGKSIYSLREIHRVMNRVLGLASGAKSAIDMALWDALGKAMGVPAYKLLGGGPKKSVRVAYVVGDETPERMAAEAKEKVNLGFDTIKIKIGSNPSKDIEAVGKIREAVGPKVRLRVDANQGYTVKTALQVIQEISPFSIDYIEQPVPGWDIDGMAHIRKSSYLPIMADESVHSPEDALQLIKREAVDLFGIKLIKCGGLYPAMKIAHLAESAGLHCVLISPWDTLAGTYAGLHLSTILPGDHAQELVGPYYLTDDPFGNLDIRGQISIPQTAGLGVEDCFDSIAEG
jgi:L-alanine-DL-glutamate epimerase-like enolase superfamily enzyme